MHKRWAAEVKPRRMLQLSQHPDYAVSCHKNSVDNLLSAVLERAFYIKTEGGEHDRPPRPARGVFARRLRRQFDLLRTCATPQEPLARGDFLSKLEPSRRRVYAIAAEELECRDISPKDARVSAFVKYEKEIHEWKVPVPRLISPRQYPFLLEDGRFFSQVEKPLMEACDSLFGAPTVMKGKTVHEVASIIKAAWDGMDHPVAIGADASRFDQHVSVDALKWQHKVQSEFVAQEHREYYRYLQSMKLVNKCSGVTNDGKVNYTIEGTRTSGDADTGGGNCLLMCSMMHAYCSHLCIPVDKFRLINNGDDCVIITEEKYKTRIEGSMETWFLALGFRMITETPVFEVEQIEFCQMRPIITVNGWVMVRNPKRALIKDCLSTRPIDSAATYVKWVCAVADAGRSLSKGVPVMQVFYENLPRNLPTLKASTSRRIQQRRKRIKLEDSGLTRWGWDRGKTDSTISEDSRVSFYLAFGVAPSDQLAIEDHIRKHPPTFGKPTPGVATPGHSWLELFD